MNITLIGYRGSGKSSVGPLLAEHLGWRAVDADRLLEQRVGQTISEMFATHGEPYFRQHEAALLQELLAEQQLVIATGGGCVMNEITRQSLRERSLVVWLQTDLETILQRMQHDPTTQGSRPALTKLPAREEIAALLEVREPIYRETSHLRIDSSQMTPPEIASQLLRQMTELPPPLRPVPAGRACG